MSASEATGQHAPRASSDRPVEPHASTPTTNELGRSFDLDARAGAADSRRPWPERLRELSHLAATSSGTVCIESNTVETIHAHLDAVESILHDQRPGLNKTIEKNQRSGSDGQAFVDVVGKKTMADIRAEEKERSGVAQNNEVANTAILTQLTAMLHEITQLNEEIDRRRREARQIRELFEERLRGLTRTVSELQDEVIELQSDLVEDAVDLEGMQGTIRGLHDWIGRVQEEQNISRVSRDLAFQKSRRSWLARRERGRRDADIHGDIILEGLSAWMRGWSDVEEGFQIRARAREMRRNQRQEQLLRSEEKPELVRQQGEIPVETARCSRAS